MRSRPSPLALLVAGAFFMEFLDGSIIATALPSMAVSLHSSAVSLNVGISAYLMTVAVFILPSGWAAQRYGTRAVFACAVAVFTLGSVLCGISGSATTFIAARVLQGLGGAMMVPVGRLAVPADHAETKTDRGHRGADLARPHRAGAGPAARRVPDGLRVLEMDFLHQRAARHRRLPAGAPPGSLRRREARSPFDLLGFVLGALACLAITRLLDLLGENGTPLTQPLLLLAAFGGLSGWFLHHIRHHQHPLIDLAPLGVATFRATLFGGAAMRMLIATMPFLLPLLFQLGFGMDAFHAGLLVIALFAGNIGIKPLTTPIIRRWGFREIFVANGMLQAVTMLGCALLSPATPVPVILILLAVSGASRSLQFTSINTLAYADVPEAMMSPANTMFSVAYQLSQGFGVALGAVSLRLAATFLGAGPGVPGRTWIRIALIGFAIAMVFATLYALRLSPNAGDHVARGRPSKG